MENLNVYLKDDLPYLELTKKNGKTVLIPTSKVLLMEDYKITLIGGKKIKVIQDLHEISEEVCRIE